MELDPVLREIADALDGRVIWVIGLGWLHWDGKVWSETDVKTPLRLVRQYDEDHGNRPRTDRTIRTLLQRARTAVEVDPQNLDAHPDLLNVQNGVVNLRTGELRTHSRARLLTKAAAVDYDPEARSDVWDQVLTAVPEASRDTLRDHVGQAVTGNIPDQATVVHGPGGSGKTTFVRAVREALGTYAVATSGLLNTQSTFDMIELRGTRFLAAEDVESIKPDRMKRLVSPDLIVARKIRQDSLVFQPSHSLFLVMNHRPDESKLDWGTRRHLAPVEFGALSETDPDLHRRVREPEALRAVLRWVVDNAVRWYAMNEQHVTV